MIFFFRPSLPQTAVASAMVNYPPGHNIDSFVRSMGVTPFYKHFENNGVDGCVAREGARRMCVCERVRVQVRAQVQAYVCGCVHASERYIYLFALRARFFLILLLRRRALSRHACSPNMATVYSDQGCGVRPPVVFYNRANEAAQLLRKVLLVVSGLSECIALLPFGWRGGLASCCVLVCVLVCVL